MDHPLVHPPSRIIAHLLMDLDLAQHPQATGATWPVTYQNQPDSPDNLITVVDTQGIVHGRLQITGKHIDEPGIQVLIRSAPSGTDAYLQARKILTAFDEHVKDRSVTVGGSSYLVRSVRRTSDVLSVGFDVGTTRRRTWSINALVFIDALSPVDWNNPDEE